MSRNEDVGYSDDLDLMFQDDPDEWPCARHPRVEIKGEAVEDDMFAPAVERTKKSEAA